MFPMHDSARAFSHKRHVSFIWHGNSFFLLFNLSDMEKKSNGYILVIDRLFLEKYHYSMQNKYSFFIVTNLQTKIIDGARTLCGSEWAGNGKIVFNDPFGRLYWIEKGRGEVNFLSGQRFNLSPGCLFVIPPLNPARYKAYGEMILYWLHFRADIFSSLDFFSVVNIRKEIKLSGKDGIDKVFWRKLLNCYQSDKISELLAADIMLRRMLAIFAKTITDVDSGVLNSLRRLEPVLHFISKNIEKKFSLSDLVELLPMNKAYFSSFFTKAIGLSPLEFINGMKVKKAQFLLLQTRMGLKEIGSQLGFRDYYYFSRVFKKHVGISPKYYRQQEAARERRTFV